MCGPPSSHRTARERTDSETEQDPGEPSWRAQGSSVPSHSMETRERRYGIPLLTRAFEWPSPERDERPPRFPPRFSPEVEPPHTPGIDPPDSVRSQHEGSESRFLRPPAYGESRHRSAPLYGSDDLERRMSFGKLPPPKSQPEGSSSRVVLPPVRDLLGEVGMLSPEQYERVPVLPQLRLPEERVPREEEERGRGRSGEKGRVEMMGEEGEERRPVVRKIYVACDFCRGRKLRCDGGRPRCFNCETRSLSCKYQDHPRRRGPGKAPKGTRARRPRKKGGGEDPDMAGPSGTL